MVPRTFVVTIVIAIAVPAMAGCNKNVSMSGVVFTSSDLEGSYIAPGLYQDDRYRPLEAAAVFLSLERGGQSITKAITNKAGEYSLDVRNLPKPKDPDGYYYLSAEKEGFMPLTERVRVGPLSRYSRNSIVLKSVAHK